MLESLLGFVSGPASQVPCRDPILAHGGLPKCNRAHLCRKKDMCERKLDEGMTKQALYSRYCSFLGDNLSEPGQGIVVPRFGC